MCEQCKVLEEVLQGQLGPGTLNRTTTKNSILREIIGQTGVSLLNYVHSSAKANKDIIHKTAEIITLL